MPGILTSEHIQDIAVAIAPIDVSGGTWNVLTGAAVTLVLDSYSTSLDDEGVRVDAGQEGSANERGVKVNYVIEFEVKSQIDTFEAGQLADMLLNYRYFRFSTWQGGVAYTWDVKRSNFTIPHEGDNASMIRFRGTQAFA